MMSTLRNIDHLGMQLLQSPASHMLSWEVILQGPAARPGRENGKNILLTDTR